MIGIVCLSAADAATFQSGVNVKLGYPKPGLNIGGGFHAPPEQTVTTSYTGIMQHPTLLQWACVPDDALVQAQSVALPVGAVAATLDTTWFPVAVALEAIVG